MITQCISRFAPSPTGRLHLGHAWSALQAHDLAHSRGGQFLLRIEDIDTGRCRSEFVSGIQEDLRWLGLDWDGPVIVQTERFEVYRHALDRLIADGLAYRCWCTRAEIAASAGAPQGDAGPAYPGTCKGRADPGGERPYCWRLNSSAATIQCGAPPLPQGDVVIARKDIPTSYHLSVTLDDAAQGVTDVVRGTDLRDATHVHRLLQALLGLPTPIYHHHALLAGPDGERLAKRHNAPTLDALRKSGTDPLRLIEGMRKGCFPFGFALMEA
jgi:glutamyl-Q tRNA(Asp) synthetase